MSQSPRWVLFGLCTCLAGCAAAAAEEPPRPAASGAATQSALTRSDAEREALRAQLRIKLRASLSHAPSSMALEQRPDGIKLMHQNGGFQHATLVVRSGDGRLTQRCTDDPAVAEAALMGDAP